LTDPFSGFIFHDIAEDETLLAVWKSTIGQTDWNGRCPSGAFISCQEVFYEIGLLYGCHRKLCSFRLLEDTIIFRSNWFAVRFNFPLPKSLMRPSNIIDQRPEAGPHCRDARQAFEPTVNPSLYLQLGAALKQPPMMEVRGVLSSLTGTIAS